MALFIVLFNVGAADTASRRAHIALSLGGKMSSRREQLWAWFARAPSWAILALLCYKGDGCQAPSWRTCGRGQQQRKKRSGGRKDPRCPRGYYKRGRKLEKKLQGRRKTRVQAWKQKPRFFLYRTGVSNHASLHCIRKRTTGPPEAR